MYRENGSDFMKTTATTKKRVAAKRGSEAIPKAGILVLLLLFLSACAFKDPLGVVSLAFKEEADGFTESEEAVYITSTDKSDHWITSFTKSGKKTGNFALGSTERPMP